MRQRTMAKQITRAIMRPAPPTRAETECPFRRICLADGLDCAKASICADLRVRGENDRP